MGGLRNMRRKLKHHRVMMAEETQYERAAFLKKMIVEKMEKSANFSKEVLLAAGPNITDEMKRIAEASIERNNSIMTVQPEKSSLVEK